MTEAVCIIAVRVIPRSPRTRVDGMRGNAVLIRVSAPPVENAANDALIDFLSGALKVPRRNLKIIAGERSRDKRVAITGIDDATAMKALGLPPS